jgi:NAD(P)-dependent dehydrogenase (short-subunit alcohol dehydrogenase family)
MKLDNAVVFITGANRGIGFAAGVRDPASVTLAGVEPIQLDVTDPSDAAAAAARCGDVTLLINNAGIASFGGFLGEGGVELARAQLETNFFGPLKP